MNPCRTLCFSTLLCHPASLTVRDVDEHRGRPQGSLWFNLASETIRPHLLNVSLQTPARSCGRPLRCCHSLPSAVFCQSSNRSPTVVQISYGGGAKPTLDSASASTPVVGSPATVACEHQASMHRHIGSAISEALDNLRPLQDPPRSLPMQATAASLRASAHRGPVLARMSCGPRSL